jgi:hypothetical protein
MMQDKSAKSLKKSPRKDHINEMIEKQSAWFHNQLKAKEGEATALRSRYFREIKNFGLQGLTQ